MICFREVSYRMQRREMALEISGGLAVKQKGGLVWECAAARNAASWTVVGGRLQFSGGRGLVARWGGHSPTRFCRVFERDERTAGRVRAAGEPLRAVEDERGVQL